MGGNLDPCCAVLHGLYVVGMSAWWPALKQASKLQQLGSMGMSVAGCCYLTLRRSLGWQRGGH